MTGQVWLAAGAFAGAVWLLVPAAPRGWPRARPRPSATGAGARPDRVSGDLVRDHRLGWALLAACGALLLVHGAVGWVLAVGAGVTVWVVVGRAEPARLRRRRERLEADLPAAVALLAAALAAGAAPGPGLDTVGRALKGPAGESFVGVAHRLALGVDPARVWADLARDPALGRLGRTLTRALDSGASVADAARVLSEDLRRDRRSEAENRARAVGVRVAAPLGACLLPAFVLVGVVPMVAGLLGTLFGR